MAFPAGQSAAYRHARRHHRKQLLFQSGDALSQALARSRHAFCGRTVPARRNIRPIQVEHGVVDLEVRRGISGRWARISRLPAAAARTARASVSRNPTCWAGGSCLQSLRDEDVDRTSTSVEFSDRHLGRSWVSMSLGYADNSDGDSHVYPSSGPSTRSIRVGRRRYPYRRRSRRTLYALGDAGR